MYVSRIACRPLVSHVEYVPCTLLRLEKYALLTLEKKEQTSVRTDGRQTVTFRLPLDAASVINKNV